MADKIPSHSDHIGDGILALVNLYGRFVVFEVEAFEAAAVVPQVRHNPSLFNQGLPLANAFVKRLGKRASPARTPELIEVFRVLVLDIEQLTDTSIHEIEFLFFVFFKLFSWSNRLFIEYQLMVRHQSLQSDDQLPLFIHS